MKTLRFTVFLLYRYYSKSDKYVNPYLSSLFALTFLVFCNLVTFLFYVYEIFLADWGFSLFSSPGYSICCFLGISFLIKVLVPKSVVIKLNYSDDRIRYGNRNLVIFLTCSVILFFSNAFLRELIMFFRQSLALAMRW